MISFLRYLFKKKMTSVSQPLVVVLGATGTGKSKLAIEIAQKFNGEIISADSMQVYKGLDIITNKVTVEEQRLVKHHLLDFVDPLEDFYVHHFRDRALEVINRLHSAGKLPVIVGGTHYYIESVLWQVLVGGADSTPQSQGKTRPIPCLPVSELSSGVGESKGEGRLACGPSAVELRSEESVTCNPSAVELRSEDRWACKPSAVELRSEDRWACKPSAVELRSEDRWACEPSAVDLRSDSSRICKLSGEGIESIVEASEQPKSEYVVGCGSADQGRDDASSEQACDAAARHRYDAGSSDHVASDDSQCSNGRMSSSSAHGKTVVEAVRDELPASTRSYERDMSEPTHVLYDDLMRVDPARAKTLHPNNRRKIIRSLEIWQRTGQTHSEHLARQRASAGGGVLGGGLRFPRALVLWCAADQEVLDARLDARVDDMLEKGLVAELLDFHDRYNKSRLKMIHIDSKRVPKDSSLPQLEGLESNDSGASNNGSGPKSARLPQIEADPEFGDSGAINNGRSKRCHTADAQSDFKKRIKLHDEIAESAVSTSENRTAAAGDKTSENGYNRTENASHACEGTENVHSLQMQPVADYTLGIFQSIGFKEFHDYLVLSPEERESEKGLALYKSGVERLKMATRRYARRQVKWIRNRFTGALDRQVPPMYRVDTTDPSSWESSVHRPAVAIVGALLRGEAPPPAFSPVSAPPTSSQRVAGRSNRHECSVCERVFIGDHQWQQHLASNAHKKCKERKRNSLPLQSDKTSAVS